MNIKKVIVLLLSLLYYILSYSQIDYKIDSDFISDGLNSKGNIIYTKFVINNKGNDTFKGRILIKPDKRFKFISNKEMDIELEPGETNYIPINFLVDKSQKVREGKHQIIITDFLGNIIHDRELDVTIPENIELKLITPQPIIYISNITDSTKARVIIKNNGNVDQLVSVVFKIHNNNIDNNFYKIEDSILVGKQVVFEYPFLSKSLFRDNSTVTINVTAMQGVSKDIFAQSAIVLQFPQSVRKFNFDGTKYQSSGGMTNFISMNYRSFDKNSYMNQIIGNGKINLPHGYIAASANIYSVDMFQNIYSNSTNLSYIFNNSEYIFGNISESLDLAMLGRGVGYKLKNEYNNDILSFGIIDQNLNLFSQDKLGINGYGGYFRYTFNNKANVNNLVVDYIYKSDKITNADHNILGLNKNLRLNNDWSFKMKFLLAHSDYTHYNTSKITQATEFSYNGKVKKNNYLNGNLTIGDNFFPGNRRGTKMLQQNYISLLDKYHTLDIYLNYSDISPKTIGYKYNFNSKMGFSQIGFKRNKNNFFIGIAYKYQIESSNGYTNGNSSVLENNLLELKSHQAILNLSKYSKNGKYGLGINLEQGFATLSLLDKLINQSRGKVNINLNDFILYLSIQNGGLYLSEQVGLLQNNTQQNFERYNATLNYNKSLFNQRLVFVGGASYQKDYLIGTSTSLNFNLKVNVAKGLTLYTNNTFYKYWKINSDAIVRNATIRNIEIGLTYNFANRNVYKGSNGTLVPIIYYDHNSNNIRDADEELAKNYTIAIDKKIFKTNNNGRIKYKNLPYGVFTYESQTQEAWNLETGIVKINKLINKVEIPLKKKGGASGEIKYEIDPLIQVNIDPKYAGLVFNIKKGEEIIHKAVTNNDGKFLIFLPEGKYTITLNTNTLQKNTSCINPTQDFEVKSGEIITLKTFIFKIQEKKINIKKFGSED